MSPEQHEQQEAIERWPIGQRIMERIRGEINVEGGPFQGEEGKDVFRSLYVTERFGCLPDHLVGEDLLVDIRSLYYCVLDGIREELNERVGPREFLWIAVDPSYEDSTLALLLTDDRVLLRVSRKAWHFYWETEQELAEELEGWYREAAARLGLVPALEPGSSTERKQLRVSLSLERVFTVWATEEQEALERAAIWRSNEDDLEVQLLYEEVTGNAVQRQEATDGEEGGGP